MLISEALSRFPAEVALLSGRGRTIDLAKAVLRAQRAKPSLRLIAGVFDDQASLVSDLSVDVTLRLPMTAVRLLRAIGHAADLSPIELQSLLEKYQKYSDAEARMKSNALTEPQESVWAEDRRDLEGSFFPRGQSREHRTERSERYEQFLQDNTEVPADLDAREVVVPTMVLARATQQLADASRDEVAELDSNQKAKQAVLVAMAKKAKQGR